ncbi:MAG: ATP-binding cassette domain-containing protein [Flavobacteriales bacterium]|nr:ATP-binding cassette domain-containing protein [Flavobacteriales bacterium]
MKKVTVKHSLNKLLAILKPHNKDILSIYLVAILHGIIALSLPIGIQMVINLITTGLYTSSWYLMIGIVILGIIAGSALQIYLMFNVERLQQKIFLFSVFDLSTLIPEWKIEQLRDKHTPEFLNRFFDLINIQKGISKILIDFTSNFFMIFFGLILLSMYHTFFLGLSIFAVLFLIFVLLITSKKGLKSSLEESKVKYKTAYWIEEMGNSVEIFKQHNNGYNLKKTDEYANQYLKYRKNHFSVLVSQYTWMSIFKVIFTSLLLVVGGILVIEQQMNIGQFVAAEIIIILIFSSIEKLITTLEYFYDLLTSVEKLSELYDIDLEHSGTELFQADKSISVDLNNVSYTYQGRQNKAIDSINLSIKTGEKIAIVSENEQFKLTLMNILAGFYDDFNGEFLVNGVPISHIEKHFYHKTVYESFSNTNVFFGTVRENLACGEEVSDLELRDYLKKFHLEKLINSLPKGLDFELNYNDKRIAVSNQLKISFIRSIIPNPKLYLCENFWNKLPEEESRTFKNFVLNMDSTVICAINGNEDLSQFDRVYRF